MKLISIELLGNHIGELIPSASGIVLHDYCRYVDDLRLVVSIDDSDVDVWSRASSSI